jgi:hypothetical protein
MQPTTLANGNWPSAVVWTCAFRLRRRGLLAANRVFPAFRISRALSGVMLAWTDLVRVAPAV